MLERDNVALIFESSPIGMLLLNENQVVSEINPFAVKFFQKKDEEIYGKRIGEVFSCSGSIDHENGCGYGVLCHTCSLREAILAAFEEDKQNESLEFHKTIVHANINLIKWFRAGITPISVKGKRNVVVSFVDITDSKQKELSALELKETAETEKRLKSEFFANMSHEVRTPLNGIVGMIDLTLLSDLNSEQEENLKLAKYCSYSLLRIIDEILDFSKLEAGKFILEHIGFDIKELITNTIKAQRSLASKKGLELTIKCSNDIPRILRGDPYRLEQVLNNLISNAIKFTDHGNVTVAIKMDNMTNEKVELIFQVSDTGIGISKEDIGKLFKTFSQVDGSITRRFGGTGLGLVISKQIVEMMGGSIWVESVPGKGSHFYFNMKFEKIDPIQETITKSKMHPLNIQAQVDFTEKVRIGSNGEIELYQESEGKTKEEILKTVNKIDAIMKDLFKNGNKLDIASIEIFAHKMKEHANQINARVIHTAAFKIELSARRGNLLESIRKLEQFRHELEIYKSLISTGEELC